MKCNFYSPPPTKKINKIKNLKFVVYEMYFLKCPMYLFLFFILHTKIFEICTLMKRFLFQISAENQDGRPRDECDDYAKVLGNQLRQVPAADRFDAYIEATAAIRRHLPRPNAPPMMPITPPAPQMPAMPSLTPQQLPALPNQLQAQQQQQQLPVQHQLPTQQQGQHGQLLISNEDLQKLLQTMGVQPPTE